MSGRSEIRSRSQEASREASQEASLKRSQKSLEWNPLFCLYGGRPNPKLTWDGDPCYWTEIINKNFIRTNRRRPNKLWDRQQASWQLWNRYFHFFSLKFGKFFRILSQIINFTNCPGNFTNWPENFIEILRIVQKTKKNFFHELSFHELSFYELSISRIVMAPIKMDAFFISPEISISETEIPSPFTLWPVVLLLDSGAGSGFRSGAAPLRSRAGAGKWKVRRWRGTGTENFPLYLAALPLTMRP